MPLNIRDSAVLTQELCKLIKQGDATHQIKEFLNQFEPNNADHEKLLRSVIQNTDLRDYRATPLITSYIISSEKTKNFEVFNIVFDKVVEMWKDDSTVFEMEIVQRRAQQYFFEGCGDGQSTPILFHATLLNLICRNSDETSLKRVIDASIDIYSGRNDRVLDMIFTDTQTSSIRNVFIYSTPSFIEQFFAQTLDRLTIDSSDESRQNCLKYIFEKDHIATFLFSDVCERATDVENVRLLFDKIQSIGGRDLLIRRFKLAVNRTFTLMTEVASKQNSVQVVKFIFETIESLNLFEDQFRFGRDIYNREVSMPTEMCRRQQNVEIVKFIFEMIERHFSQEFQRKYLLVDDPFDLYFHRLFVSCQTNPNPHVLKFLFDSAISINVSKFRNVWVPSQEFSTFLFNCAKNNNDAGVMMVLAHFSNEQACQALTQDRDDHGRTAAAMTSSPKVQQLLKKPNPWEFSVESYWKIFDGALPPIAPWKNDDTFSWLKNIVDETDGLEINSTDVMDLIFGLSENNITSPEGLGATEQTKVDEILSWVKNDTLKVKIKTLAESELEKRQTKSISNNEVVALPFFDQLIQKHSLGSASLSDASRKILIENEIDTLDIFLQLTPKELEDMKLKIGARKTLQDIQSKAWLLTQSETANHLRSLFPSSNSVVPWGRIKIGNDLGEGGFGCVKKATILPTSDGEQQCDVAVKLFKHVHSKKVLQECAVAMKLRHRNIISTIGVSIFIGSTGHEEIAAVLELGKGTLHEKLASRLEWKTVFKYSFEIASGLDYLHNTAKINHLDLKPVNVLLDENNIVKLCDFGLSRVMEDDQTHADVSRAGFGSYRWMCPEQLVSPEMRPTNDVYSFGCILYNMIDDQGRKPWYDVPDKKIPEKLTALANVTESTLAKRISSEHRGDCPEFLLELCQKCLNSDYKMRPKDGGELVQLLKSGILEFVAGNEVWRVKIGNLSYLDEVVPNGGDDKNEQSSTSCDHSKSEKF